MLRITLKAARVNAGLSLVEAARRINRAPATLSSWENNHYDIPVRDFKNLCTLYNIGENYIALPGKLSQSQAKERDDE